MGNIELKVSLLCIAVMVSGVAIFLFYKNKISKKGMFTTVVSSFIVSVVAVVLVTLLIEPQLKLNGSRVVNVPVFGEYAEDGCSAFLINEDISKDVKIKSTVDTNKVGKYRVIYSVVYRGRVYTNSRTVIVEDKVSPEIKLNGETKIIVSAMKYYKEAGVTATDNYDGDISKTVEIEQKKLSDEKYQIVYNVTDTSGNQASTVREIEIKDLVKPVLKLKNDATVYVNQGSKYTDYGATATDDVDGDITKKITVSGTVNTAVLGSYTVSYIVKDSSGNKSTVTRRVVVRVPEDPTKNRICLTFDDGPSSVTKTILDVLKKNNVKATFFICDYSESSLPIIKRMINEGHTIGIHGYSHDYAAIYKSETAFMNNINKLRDKLYKDTGYTATVMRFPGGSSNTIANKYCSGIMKKLKVTVTDAGWRYFDWNVSSEDATGSISANTIYKNTINGLKKKRTNVVLMHDASSKKTTAQSLQKIIDYAKANSYSFYAIDDTIPQIVH